MSSVQYFIAIYSMYGYTWSLYMFIALGTAQGFIVSVVFILKKRIFNLYRSYIASVVCHNSNHTQN